MGQFENPDYDFNAQSFKVEPITLIDEYSSTVFYIGVSSNGRDTAKTTWQIKKIEQIGTVWSVTKFPNGDQSFKFAWDSRTGYTYI